MKVGIGGVVNHDIPVEVKLLYDDAKMPYKASDYAVGHDLFAYIPDGSVSIKSGQTVKIGTGIAVSTPSGCWSGLFARSGLATKKGLRLANSVGVVDPDYRGEIIVALHNDSNETQTVNNGERIAQIAILPYYPAEFIQVDNLPETNRGDGGFGSTGDV